MRVSDKEVVIALRTHQIIQHDFISRSLTISAMTFFQTKVTFTGFRVRMETKLLRDPHSADHSMLLLYFIEVPV